MLYSMSDPADLEKFQITKRNIRRLADQFGLLTAENEVLKLFPLSYDTWTSGMELIEHGEEAISGLLGLLGIESAGLTLLLEFLVWLLGWGLKRLWSALPHYGPPAERVPDLPIEYRGKQMQEYRQETGMNPAELSLVSSQVGHGRDKKRWQLNRMDINTVSNILTMLQPMPSDIAPTIIRDTSINNPLGQVMSISDKAPAKVGVDVGIRIYPKAVVEKNLYPGRTRQPVQNPTMGRAGY